MKYTALDYNGDQISPKKGSEQGAVFLKEAMRRYMDNGNKAEFLEALRTVTNAQGGIYKLSKLTNITRPNMYRALSGTGNPKMETLVTILQGLGFRLDIGIAGGDWFADKEEGEGGSGESGQENDGENSEGFIPITDFQT